MSQRFVILIHTGHGPTHYDLMLEQADTLATWQFETNPGEVSAGGLPCRRLPDHRKHYLDYEGAVGGDRGDVKRMLAGHWTAETLTPLRWEFHLDAEGLCGTFELRQRSDATDNWTLQRLTD